MGIPQSTLCRILKDRKEIKKNVQKNGNASAKRMRAGKEPEVEEALKLWFTNAREKDARVSGPLMRMKSEDLDKKMGKEGFTASTGWVHRWKKHESIVYKRLHREAKDADIAGAESWIKNVFPKMLDEFSTDKIYNCDETALYFRALPQHTYALKSDTWNGSKVSKDLVTVLCCVSMSGEKKDLVVIGKSKKPRCFNNVRKLPTEYHSNANAWMTRLIFHQWLLAWDRSLKHDIALLLDNCIAHTGDVTLKHIKLFFSPANTTALI